MCRPILVRHLHLALVVALVRSSQVLMAPAVVVAKPAFPSARLTAAVAALVFGKAARWVVLLARIQPRQAVAAQFVCRQICSRSLPAAAVVLVAARVKPTLLALAALAAARCRFRCAKVW